MLKTKERLNLILTLNNYKLDLKLLESFDMERLLQFCSSIKQNSICYDGFLEIQKELIRDERFFFYLSKIIDAEIPIASINSFLNVLHLNGENALDYPLPRLIDSMIITEPGNVFYDYLKYFSDLKNDKEQKEIIVKNLRLYSELLLKPDVGKYLFLESALTNAALVPPEAGRAFKLLTRTNGLMSLIRFFYENDIDISLTIDNYENFINQNPRVIREELEKLFMTLGKDSMNLLMDRWTENNCPSYDLVVLNKSLAGLDEKQLADVLHSRSGYINLIYGSKICNIALIEIPNYKEDILIYAITNKKNSFIKLVEENYKTFSLLGSQSILFKREFYANHVNLNSLNASNLLDCGRMEPSKMLFNALEFGRSYTFEEIKTLYGIPEQYYKLYACLQLSRVDIRLIVIKQLIKHKLLADITDAESISILADKFTQKPLSKWREQDFSHIDGLKLQDAVNLLRYQTEVEKFIPQMRTRTDAKLILRNRNSVKNYTTIDGMKEDLNKIDNTWNEFIGKLGFTNEFLRKNQEHVIEFLCQNGAEIAKTFYDNLSNDNQRESMKRIIKAELMGAFSTLKYYDDDLRKEIDYPTTDMQKEFWKKNTELDAGNGTLIKECDDFYSIMMVGMVPQRTCLSYIDGQYKECLLSNFDSNKKILYAYVNGKVVSRAIIRLTKGRFSNTENPKAMETSLTFVDLETPQTAKIETEAEKEQLVLFLEHLYSSGITNEKINIIQDKYIDLMSKKAEQMGAMLVLSSSYKESCQSDFTRTLFHVYISKSKSGAQYLDSLGGVAAVSDEGGYKTNNFYIRNEDIL